MSHYSTIIKNGTVFDGKGSKPVKTDIGISDDEIIIIGDLQREAAYNIVDATGKYVAPGFIDITNHSDTHWSIFSSPGQESLVSQGITTIIGGNCGSSLAPFLGESSAKEIGRWADISKVNVNWQTLGQFLEEMDKHKLGINFGTFVGLNTIRRSTINDRQQIKKTGFLLELSLRDGAFGVSTNFGLDDIGFFTDDNLVAMLNRLKPYGVISKHHLEDEGQNLLPVVSRLIFAARESGSNLHISHFKALGRSSWNFFEAALKMIQSARNDGARITYDFFPYTKTGSKLLSLLPLWFRKYSLEEALNILSSEKEKKRQDLKNHLKSITLHYDKIIVASATVGLGKTGRTIKELSVESDREPEEVILNLLEANKLRVSIFNEVISENNLEIIAKDDYSVLSSDGVGCDLDKKNTNDLPHPRSFGAFPRAISQFVKKKEIISIETMICKMSGLPAKILGITDRGILEKGKKADIVIFDPVTIEDAATYEEPFAAARGIESVFVNGKLAITAGKFTGLMSGKILRHK